jgi:hypothetical protein
MHAAARTNTASESHGPDIDNFSQSLFRLALSEAMHTRYKSIGLSAIALRLKRAIPVRGLRSVSLL